MRILRVAGLAAALCVAVAAAKAADFVNLEWGEFKLSYESSVKPKSITTDNRNGELGLSMVLDSFSAGADGAKMEGSSSIAGEFVIQQPHYAKFPAMSVQLKGTLIKTPGTTAEIIVSIGNVEQRIDWKTAETVAGAYSKVLSIDVPDGQLPVPFPLNVQAFVKREPGSGGILLTLDTINIRIGQPGVASYFTAEELTESRALAIELQATAAEDRR